MKENNSTVLHGLGSSLAELRIRFPPDSTNPSIKGEFATLSFSDGEERINQARKVASKARLLMS